MTISFDMKPSSNAAGETSKLAHFDILASRLCGVKNSGLPSQTIYLVVSGSAYSYEDKPPLSC
jgi:hypothetical protein